MGFKVVRASAYKRPNYEVGKLFALVVRFRGRFKGALLVDPPIAGGTRRREHKYIVPVLTSGKIDEDHVLVRISSSRNVVPVDSIDASEWGLITNLHILLGSNWRGHGRFEAIDTPKELSSCGYDKLAAGLGKKVQAFGVEASPADLVVVSTTTIADLDEPRKDVSIRARVIRTDDLRSRGKVILEDETGRIELYLPRGRYLELTRHTTVLVTDAEFAIGQGLPYLLLGGGKLTVLS